MASDLRLSPTEPGRLRFLGEVTNDGDQPVQAIITVCFGGVTYSPAMLPGVILPDESAPFVFLFDGDDTSVEHDVAVSGFVIDEAEIAETQPTLVIVDEEMHDPDTSHPTMWLTMTIRNEGEIMADAIQIAVTLYQANGEIREVEIVNVAPTNPQTGEVGLAGGQAAALELPLDGVRSLSGEYEVRVVGITEESEATPPNEESQTV